MQLFLLFLDFASFQCSFSSFFWTSLLFSAAFPPTCPGGGHAGPHFLTFPMTKGCRGFCLVTASILVCLWPCFFLSITDGHSGSVHKGCRTLQVIQSTLPYSAGHPVQTAVHCRSSRLPYTAGHPGCRTLQVTQAAVHCRSSRLPCTASHPDCSVLQVIQAADKIPRHRSLHRPQLTPVVVV